LETSKQRSRWTYRKWTLRPRREC